MGYSLWDSPWIPAIDDSGQLKLLSIRGTLVQADHLREVFDASPLVVVAVTRLLQTVLYRVFKPKTHADWAQLWRTGCFDSGPLDRYGDIYRDSFDLLHPDNPFSLAPKMPDENEHPISALVLEAASGNNPTLFDHGFIEGQTWLPLNRVACSLMAHQLFAVGGGVSKPFNRMDAPLTKGLIVQAAGRNLFESLMLNLIPLERWQSFVPNLGDDCPFWEMDTIPPPDKEGTTPRGPLHYLTWQSREIHLILDNAVERAERCQIRQRYAMPKSGERIDPYKPYIYSEKDGWQPFKLDKHRSVWQHTYALLQQNCQVKDNKIVAPELTNWLAFVRYTYANKLDLPKVYDYYVAGLAMDPRKAAKIELWRKEQLSIPLEFFGNDELVNILEQMLSWPKRIESHLFRTSVALAWSLGEKNHLSDAISYIWKGMDKKADSYRTVAASYGMIARFWPALEEPFRLLLNDLPDRGYAEVKDDWICATRTAAMHSYADVRETLLLETCTLEVLTQIEHAFLSKLNKLVEKLDGEEDGKDEGAE